MNGEINITGIRNLAVSGKRSKICRLRSIKNEIEKVLAAGVSLDRVVSELNVQGMELTLATFKMMLYRLRKENKTAATEVAVGPEIGAPADPVLSQQRNVNTPRILSSTENVGTNASPGSDTLISKSIAPGEPKRFDWESLRNAKDNWS